MFWLWRKSCRFKDLDWEADYLNTYRFESPEDVSKAERARQKRQEAKEAVEKKEYLQTLPDRICLPAGRGKITDSGCDQFKALYARIPGKVDFTLRVRLRVHSFLEDTVPTGQEGFGVFVRDTMEPDPQTGQYYSNMAAVGAYYGCYNIFGRDQITADDFGHIRNFYLNRAPEGQAAVRISAEEPVELDLFLEKKGGVIRAGVRDQSGRDLLEGTDTWRRQSRGVCTASDQGVYQAEITEDAFRQIECSDQYIGIMAARGADVEVLKDTFRLTLHRRMPRIFRGHEKELTQEQTADVPAEAPAPASGQILYASPGGTSQAQGTREDALDLVTALKKCDAGDELRLMPGTYHMQEQIILGDGFGVDGIPSACAKLCADPQSEEEPVLDFGNLAHALMVTGSGRMIEGISVTAGYGIWIAGSYNHIARCRAYRNRETGILIRHLSNDSPRRLWPSHNLVEGCVSYENMDLSENNADGFACKAAAGEGNRFVRCIAELNSDDGFDLFAKNRPIGAVILEDCESLRNGYKKGADGTLTATKGNGNGFKLGGSGLAVRHQAHRCTAKENRGSGFTSNSNPVMLLYDCCSQGNDREEYSFFYSGAQACTEKVMENCT